MNVKISVVIENADSLPCEMDMTEAIIDSEHHTEEVLSVRKSAIIPFDSAKECLSDIGHVLYKYVQAEFDAKERKRKEAGP